MITVAESEEIQLTAKDRCDTCGVSSDGAGVSRALVRVLVPTKGGMHPLDFCSHHFAFHESALSKNNARIVFDGRRFDA
jgi:hypothetical protein